MNVPVLAARLDGRSEEQTEAILRMLRNWDRRRPCSICSDGVIFTAVEVTMLPYTFTSYTAEKCPCCHGAGWHWQVYDS